MARSWYTYDGSGDVDQPSNYIYATTKPSCRTGFQVCSIYAVYGGTNPETISENLLTYISNGLSTGVSQPTVPVGAKKYVYMRPVG